MLWRLVNSAYATIYKKEIKIKIEATKKAFKQEMYVWTARWVVVVRFPRLVLVI